MCQKEKCSVSVETVNIAGYKMTLNSKKSAFETNLECMTCIKIEFL